MLTINRQSDYAARVLLVLAMQPEGTRMTIQEIARRQRIPLALARRIATRLVSAGFLHSLRGSGGGISLARRPAEITLLEVIEAIEGRLVLNRCVIEPEDCPLEPQCPVRQVWVDAHGLLTEHLGVSFDELVQRRQKIT